MKYEDFWKELNNNNKKDINLKESIEDNKIILSLKEKFFNEINYYLDNEEEENEERKINYKIKFKEFLEDVPKRIREWKFK